eukprot:619103-Pyramimonas_sp.AAC.1
MPRNPDGATGGSLHGRGGPQRAPRRAQVPMAAEEGPGTAEVGSQRVQKTAYQVSLKTAQEAAEKAPGRKKR